MNSFVSSVCMEDNFQMPRIFTVNHVTTCLKSCFKETARFVETLSNVENIHLLHIFGNICSKIWRSVVKKMCFLSHVFEVNTLLIKWILSSNIHIKEISLFWEFMSLHFILHQLLLYASTCPLTSIGNASVQQRKLLIKPVHGELNTICFDNWFW